MAVAEQVPESISLTSLSGDEATLDDWMTTFQLALVVLDPYTSESSWIIDTAGPLLNEFREADCRAAWVVTSDADDARTFLGPWADQLLTFCDPERSFVRGVGLSHLPAFVHLRQDRVVVSTAEGWDPAEWDSAIAGLTRMMSWTKLEVPPPGRPGAVPRLPRLTPPPTSPGDPDRSPCAPETSDHPLRQSNPKRSLVRHQAPNQRPDARARATRSVSGSQGCAPA